MIGTRDTPGVELVVPVIYSKKTCIASIVDLEPPRPASDAFTMRYLAQKLERMTGFCVRPAPHLGGEGRIGEKEELWLVVRGLEEPGQEAGIEPATGLNNVTVAGSWGDFVVMHGGEPGILGTLNTGFS